MNKLKDEIDTRRKNLHGSKECAKCGISIDKSGGIKAINRELCGNCFILFECIETIFINGKLKK